MASTHKYKATNKNSDVSNVHGRFQFVDPGAPRILMLECDDEFAHTLKQSLESEGYDVRCFDDAYSDFVCLRGLLPNLIILQIHRPDLRALEFIRQLRANRELDPVKIIALSEKSDEYEKMRYLTIGCDDIVSAPFSICELVARAWAHLRFMRVERSYLDTPSKTTKKKAKTKLDLLASDIQLDFYSRKVKRGEREILLGNAQFHLLATLLDNPGVLFSREELAELLWENPSSNDLRTIDTLVMRLRKKICQEGEIDPIASVRGSGYFLKQNY